MGNIFMPSGTCSYPGIPHTRTRVRALCPPTHTPCNETEGRVGERSSTSVRNRKCWNSRRYTTYYYVQHVDRTDRQLLWVGQLGKAERHS